MNHKFLVLRRILTAGIILVLLMCVFLFSVNVYVINKVSDYVYSDLDKFQKNTSDKSFECILVLGCGVVNGHPSVMLEDRLKATLVLYDERVAPKVLLSGDHGTISYDEVNVMRDYLMERGIPSEDIFMDHAGFSTYESMRRAKEVFGCSRIVVITQEYHLYRSLYDSRILGIESYGFIATGHEFVQQPYYTAREYLARFKDFFLTKINPQSAFVGGDKIDITGDGNVTIG